MGVVYDIPQEPEPCPYCKKLIKVTVQEKDYGSSSGIGAVILEQMDKKAKQQYTRSDK